MHEDKVCLQQNFECCRMSCHCHFSTFVLGIAPGDDVRGESVKEDGVEVEGWECYMRLMTIRLRYIQDMHLLQVPVQLDPQPVDTSPI